MKIGVSAKSGSMEAEVEPRFGRCAFFLIVDLENMQFEAFSNPATDMSGGAGPRTVQEFVNRGAEAILTGHVGPKAESALSAANLKVVTGVSGKVREAVEAFLAERG